MRVACSMSAWKGDIEGTLSAIAAMGFRYVDIIAIPGWGMVDPDEAAEAPERIAVRLEAALNRNGLTAVAMNAAVPTIYERDSSTQNARRLAQVEGLCRIMHHLGIRVGSFFPGGNWPAQHMDWGSVLRAEVVTLREMLEIGGPYGVTITVEPHVNTPFEKLRQIRCLLESLPELKVTYDPSHFAMQGISLGDTGFLLDRAVHVHVRDAAPGALQVPVGTGVVDFAGLVRELRTRDYHGALSVEYLPEAPTEVEKMAKTLDSLLRR